LRAILDAELGVRLARGVKDALAADSGINEVGSTALRDNRSTPVGTPDS
jgi:hypothetical protein